MYLKNYTLVKNIYIFVCANVLGHLTIGMHICIHMLKGRNSHLYIFYDGISKLIPNIYLYGYMNSYISMVRVSALYKISDHDHAMHAWGYRVYSS